MGTLKTCSVTTLGFLLAGVGVGCNSNPNPEVGVLTGKQVIKREVELPFNLTIRDWIEFTERKKSEISFEAKVPAPGIAKVRIEGLPQGAEFDPAEMKIKWTPDSHAGDDPRVPAQGYRTYRLHFFVTSSEDPVSTLERSVTFFVRDVPSELSIAVDNRSPELTENKEFKSTLTVKSEDYPQGPFTLAVRGFPFSPMITQDPQDPGRFTIAYTPSFLDVTVKNTPSSDWDLKRKFNGEFTVFTPNGKFKTLFAEWVIEDAPQEPVAHIPTQVSDGPNVNFAIAAEDLNGEEPPSLAFKSRPKFGKAVIDLVASTTTFQSGFVRWTEIPKQHFGTTQTLAFQVCVRGTRLCTDRQVEVQIAKPKRFPPLVTRDEWLAKVTRYVRAGERLEVALPVAALPIQGESEKEPSITFEGPGASVVSWAGGKLAISSRVVGKQKFILKATSEHGLVTSETFVYEVLPENWSSILVVGRSQNSAEAVYNLGLARAALENGMEPQFISPRWSGIEDRMLALRTTILSGSEALSDDRVREHFETAATKIKNVVILSPRFNQIHDALAPEFSSIGLKGTSSWSQVGHTLASVQLAATPQSGVESPSIRTGANAKLTSASSSPLTLELSAESNCVPALVLTKPGLSPEPIVTVTCPRTNGGVAVLSGIEWGDLDWSTADQALAAAWLKKWVKP